MILHLLLVRLTGEFTRSQEQGLPSHREDTCLLEAPRHGHHPPHGHGVPALCGGRGRPEASIPYRRHYEDHA
jgi:hypothetical protein